jgi:hypothetical protein
MFGNPAMSGNPGTPLSGGRMVDVWQPSLRTDARGILVQAATGGEAQDDVAVTRRGGHGPPAARESPFQQFLGSRPMVEDGDRHHGSQSACLEDRVNGVRHAHDHVVVELVLDDHVNKLGARLARETTGSPPPASRTRALPPRPRRVAREPPPHNWRRYVRITTLPKWAPLSRYLRASGA